MRVRVKIVSEEVIHSKEMRLRMTQLEYNDVSEEEFKKEIERMYVEEYGEKLPAEIDVYSTSNLDNFKNDTSGYQGTAIYFHSEENNIDEVYVISQGTQEAEDWEYNIKAMLAGQDATQAKGTYKFVNEAKKEFSVSDSTPVTGLSHSLAHNNNATAHLLYDMFDDVYSVNGAQTNFYQLYNNSQEFEKSVNREFSITPSDPNAVYNIDPDKLKAFAKDFYKDKGENIHQLISVDDPLYAVCGLLGFFTLGDVEMYDTKPDYPGLHSIMDDIPDDTVKDLQEMAIQYATVTKGGDIDAGIKELTGVNMELLNKIDGLESGIKVYATHQKEFEEMVHNLDDKLPEIFAQVKKVTENSDDILQRFVDAGYIDGDEKDTLAEELSNIENDLEHIQDVVSDWKDMHDSTGPFNIIRYMNDAESLLQLALTYRSFKKRLDQLNKEEFLDTIKVIGNGHDISGVLKAVSGGNKSYKGGDMFLAASGGSDEIQVNMSAALRLYDKGKELMEDKKEEIKKLQSAVAREIESCYKQEKRKVMKQID